MSFSKVIAIDGPSGSGKSTIAKDLAVELGVLYIDTGAMFRGLAYWADKKNIEFKSGEEISSFLKNIQVDYGKSSSALIVIDGEDLTAKIREHNVSKLASIISQIPEVRTYLLAFQRELATQNVCVMEGRDIGTVVFPDSFCKFFITASVEVRSKRRLQQLQEAGDEKVTLLQVMSDVQKRDESDINREVAPLKQATDATLLDTSEMDLSAVLSTLKSKTLESVKSYGISL